MCAALLGPAVCMDRGYWAAEKPNILLIVGDDMGYADVAFMAAAIFPLRTSMRSQRRASVHQWLRVGPYCSPTRAGLMTGRYQNRFGHEFNVGAGTRVSRLTETTLADRLKAPGT